MASKKILIAALPTSSLIAPGTWNATDATSQLARLIRAHDRSLLSSDVVQLPIVDGGEGTIDFLVSHTLGSFLEVEATGASGEDIVVPLGFAGEDGKLAVMEMARVAAVSHLGDSGTTSGIGQLIQDALDEGAFSIILGHEEPLAYDAGLGAASALGVRFFDSEDKEIIFALPGANVSDVARVDSTGRSFSLLSSRVFIARSRNAQLSTDTSRKDDLTALAEIIRRDTGIASSTAHLSASAVEFGLVALLGAEVREGSALVLEASKISESIGRGEFSECILITTSLEEVENNSVSGLIELIRSHIKHRAVIITEGSGKERSAIAEPEFYLQDVTLFQSPLREGASAEERSRDASMRLEKLVPTVLESLRGTHASKAMKPKEVRV